MIIVELAGHLGTDPEVRHSPSGQKITTLRIATNSRRQGKDITIWWRATIFGDHLDKMLSFLKKGSAVIAIGKMTSEPQIYTDKNGQQQVSLEIIVNMLEFSPFGKGSDRSGQEQGNNQQYYGGDNRTPQQQNRQPAQEHSFAPPSYSNQSPAYEGHSPYQSNVDSFQENVAHGHQDQFADNEQVPF